MRPPSHHHKSIIRDGNHFIWLDGSGWVLIDGPWFEQMRPYARGAFPVFRAPKPRPWAFEMITSPYATASIEYLEWEPVSWSHSYMRFSHEHPKWWSWQKVNLNRIWRGWRVKGSGALPAHMGSVEPVSEYPHQ